MTKTEHAKAEAVECDELEHLIDVLGDSVAQAAARTHNVPALVDDRRPWKA